MAERTALSCKLEPHIQNADSEFQLIWDDIGICSEMRNERIQVVVDHVNTLLGEMIGEEKVLKMDLLKSIDECTAQIAIISKELSMLDYTPIDGSTVLQREKELRIKLEELRQEKRKRLKKLKKLRQENLILSSSLGAEPFYIPTSVVPSEEFIKQIQAHTKTLIAEKDTRLKTFYATKNIILDLFRELERVATPKEKSLYDNENLILSLDTLDKLENLKEELEHLNKEKENEAIILRENLSKFWDRLRIQHCERDAFLALYPGHKPSSINAFKDEIEKLRNVQREKVKEFVTNLRKELVILWDKCYYGPEQRDLFRAFHDDSFSEELLEIHALEVEKLKSFLDENRDLLQKVFRREQLWKQMIEFEKKASDPNRFTNRGGNLLLEEKERKKLLKDLPKLETELENMALEWENKHGKILRVYGKRLIDFMASEWEKHKLEKETEKAERQKAKVKQIEEEMYKGSKNTTPSLKRKIETPVSSRKRILMGDASMRNKTAKSHSSLMGFQTPKNRILGFPKTESKPPQGRRRRSRSVPPGTALGQSEFKENFNVFNKTVLSELHNGSCISIASTAASYGEFSNHLQNRDQGIFNSTSLNLE